MKTIIIALSFLIAAPNSLAGFPCCVWSNGHWESVCENVTCSGNTEKSLTGRWQGSCTGFHSVGGKKQYTFPIIIEKDENYVYFREVGLTYLPTVPLKIRSGRLYENGVEIGRVSAQHLFVHRRQPTGPAISGNIADYSIYIRLTSDGQKLFLSDHAFWKKDNSDELGDCVFTRAK